MLEKEYQYYLNNEKELVKKHYGRYLVIKNDQVIGNYENEKDAYDRSITDHKLGTFLIQRAVPENERPVQTFHSRVIL